MRSSIVAKLNIVLIILVVGISLVFSGMFAFTSYKSESEILDQQVEQVVALSAQNLMDVIWDIDIERMERLVDSLLEQEAIIGVHIVDSTGTIDWNRGNHNLDHTFIGVVTREIVKDGQVIASMKITVDKQGIVDRILNTMNFLLIMTVVKVLVIGVAIVFFANRVIKRPIKELEKDVDKIHKGDLSVPIGSSLVREDEIGNFAKRFEEMRNSISDKVKIIEHQNKSLEQKVMARTQDLTRRANDLRAVFDSSDQIIFIVGKNLEVLDYSKETDNLIGSSESGNKFQSFVERSLLGEADTEIVLSVVRTSIGNDPLNFEVNKNNLPTELVFQENDKKIPYQMVWGYILDASHNEIEKVIISARDMSLHKEFTQYQMVTEERLKIMGELIGVNLNLAIESLELARHIVTEIREKDLGEKALGQLHTLKGNFRISGMSIIAGLVHGVEGAIKKDGDLQEQLDLMSQTIDKYLDIIARIQINNEPSADFIDVIRARLDSEMTVSRLWLEEALEARDQGLHFLSAIRTEMDHVIESTAQGCGKKKPHLKFTFREEVYLDFEYYQLLKTCFLHLASNSIDHGIESSEVRKAHGKDEVGTIHVGIHFSAKDLVIQFWDDGQGISVQQLGDPQGTEELMESINHLIFDRGRSSAEKVTQISGRGIGMADLKERIELIGGSIDCFFNSDSEGDHIPIRFLLKIPIREMSMKRSS